MSPSLLATRNILKAIVLLGGFVGALTALGWWLAGVQLAGVCAAIALLIMTTIHWYGPRIVLTSLRARELLLGEAPLLHTTVDRLAAITGVPRPKLYLLADGFPRALAVGRGATDSGIAVSQGLLTMATPAELEGILAHELAHVRHRDVTVQTPTVLIATWLVEASRIGGFLERALLFLLGPIAASLVHLSLSPKREFAADAAAARTCDSPHGIADALVHLEQAMELVRFSASPTTEPLYTVNPFGGDRLAVMFNTHPSLAERVSRLRELDPDWRERLRAA